MLLFVLVLLCLFASFIFENRKMRVKSITQLMLALILFFIVFFFLPNAPFEKLTLKLIGYNYLHFLQAVVTDVTAKVSVLHIIAYAVFFLTFLSIFDIVVYVKEKIEVKRELTWKTENAVKHSFETEVENNSDNKKYLLFCRFLN